MALSLQPLALGLAWLPQALAQVLGLLEVRWPQEQALPPVAPPLPLGLLELRRHPPLRPQLELRPLQVLRRHPPSQHVLSTAKSSPKFAQRACN
jgi:hypothetical protein